MKLLELDSLIKPIAQKSSGLLTTKQLAILLAGESEPVRKATLQRAVKAGILDRVARGLYASPDVFKNEPHKLEAIAKSLRPGEYSYLSLESVLSEHSVISQMPLSRITVMTTGRKQSYETQHGTVELTHTSRSIESILDGTHLVQGRPLRQATLKTALEDQFRVKRNLHMVDLKLAEELLNVSH